MVQHYQKQVSILKNTFRLFARNVREKGQITRAKDFLTLLNLIAGHVMEQEFYGNKKPQGQLSSLRFLQILIFIPPPTTSTVTSIRLLKIKLYWLAEFTFSIPRKYPLAFSTDKRAHFITNSVPECSITHWAENKSFCEHITIPLSDAR